MPQTRAFSLHDALPISRARKSGNPMKAAATAKRKRYVRTPLAATGAVPAAAGARSEEHTSELQSRRDLVCRLLLEQKKAPLENASEQQRAAVLFRLPSA